MQSFRPGRDTAQRQSVSGTGLPFTVTSTQLPVLLLPVLSMWHRMGSIPTLCPRFSARRHHCRSELGSPHRPTDSHSYCHCPT